MGCSRPIRSAAPCVRPTRAPASRSTCRRNACPSRAGSKCAIPRAWHRRWSMRLPYLVDYPYGCTEQTLNRFLPTVITQKVLLGMNLDLKAIEAKRTNLNAQEIGDDANRAAGLETQQSAEPRRARAQPGLRCRYRQRHDTRRHRSPGEHAAWRRRVGLVQRVWRTVLPPHHRPGRPRAADRAAGRCRSSRAACSIAA